MSNLVHQFSSLKQFPELVHGISPRSLEEGELLDMREATSRGRLLRLLEVENAPLLWSQQTHGDEIHVHRSDEPFPTVPLKTPDALVTDQDGVMLMVCVADCQPIFIYEPNRRVVAAVHSGWRGSAKNIVGKTVRAMRDQLQADPMKMWVAIGPSLGPCCATFSDPENELPQNILHHRLPGNRMDFWALTTEQLMTEGVPASQIENSQMCTVCHRDRWFSHRGDGGSTGRGGAMIGLRAKG